MAGASQTYVQAKKQEALERAAEQRTHVQQSVLSSAHSLEAILHRASEGSSVVPYDPPVRMCAWGHWFVCVCVYAVSVVVDDSDIIYTQPIQCHVNVCKLKVQ